MVRVSRNNSFDSLFFMDMIYWGQLGFNPQSFKNRSMCPSDQGGWLPDYIFKRQKRPVIRYNAE